MKNGQSSVAFTNSGESHLFEIALKPMSGHSVQRDPNHHISTRATSQSGTKGVRASSNSLMNRYLALDSNAKHAIK